MNGCRLIVVVALLLAGCFSDPSELVRAPVRAKQVPGAHGHSILLITAQPQSILSPTGDDEFVVIQEIAELDGGLSETVDVLHTYSKDSRHRIRRAAVVALSMASHPSAALVLLSVLRDPHPTIRRVAREALAARSVTERDLLFERAVRHDESGIVRGVARAWPLLIESSAPRILAALQEMTDTTARFQFIANHCSGLPEEVSDYVSQSEKLELVAASESCRLEPWTGEGSHRANKLLELFGEAPPELRKAIASHLRGQLARIEAAQHPEILALLNELELEESALEGIAIQGVRYALNGAGALETLAASVSSENADRRVEALALLRILGSASSELRESALVTALESVHQDADPWVREAAADVAGATGDGRVGAWLVQRMSDSEARVRLAAVWSLGRVGVRHAVSALIERGIEDEDSQVRDASYVVLHRIVHGHTLPIRSMTADWLGNPSVSAEREFWGRNRERWRRWYQLER